MAPDYAAAVASQTPASPWMIRPQKYWCSLCQVNAAGEVGFEDSLDGPGNASSPDLGGIGRNGELFATSSRVCVTARPPPRAKKKAADARCAAAEK
jgi:hypothetical protein